LVSLLAIIGAIVLRLVVLPRAGWPPELIADAGDRARALAQGASVLLLCTTVYRAAGQAQMMAGAPSGFLEAIGSLVRDTRWGQVGPSERRASSRSSLDFSRRAEAQAGGPSPRLARCLSRLGKRSPDMRPATHASRLRWRRTSFTCWVPAPGWADCSSSCSRRFRPHGASARRNRSAGDADSSAHTQRGGRICRTWL
jgi:hypothetical protein